MSSEVSDPAHDSCRSDAITPWSVHHQPEHIDRARHDENIPGHNQIREWQTSCVEKTAILDNAMREFERKGKGNGEETLGAQCNQTTSMLKISYQNKRGGCICSLCCTENRVLGRVELESASQTARGAMSRVTSASWWCRCIMLLRRR